MVCPQLPSDLLAESLLQYDPAEYFVPVKDYALQPLPTAFQQMEATLCQLFKKHPDVQKFDATAFYSKRRTGLNAEDEAALAAYNQAAFTAAEGLGGLVVYYQGHLLEPRASARLNPALELDFTPNCLSFCIWESRLQAVAGANVTAHRKAASKVGQWYENFAIKKFTILIVQSSPDVSLLPENVIFQAY